MKYVIFIPDGSSDFPIDELEGKTPLQVANTPNIDRLASVPTAYVLMVILTLLSALLLFFLPQRAGETAGIVAFYFLLNMEIGRAHV